MAEKAKFDREAAFKSIIGAGRQSENAHGFIKSKKLLVMICAFAAIIGVFALVNAKEKPIEYSREELAELFEKYPVSLLCKEFDEKKVILSNPSSKEELNALIGSLTLEDPKLFEYDGKKSTIYSGTTENCESFAFLENNEEKVLVIENTDNNENREQWAHVFHLKERTVTESFFKSDVKNDLHITLTFEGEKGYIE